MTRQKAYLDYVLMMAVASHYRQWEQEAAGFYTTRPMSAKDHEEFGNYFDRIQRDLKLAREAIEKLEEKILQDEGNIPF